MAQVYKELGSEGEVGQPVYKEVGQRGAVAVNAGGDSEPDARARGVSAVHRVLSRSTETAAAAAEQLYWRSTVLSKPRVIYSSCDKALGGYHV